MSKRVDTTPPPDDTGSETFRRYRYQAHVAFSSCVDCGLLGGIAAVIPEHFEDVAVQHASSGVWEFQQIKTRDQDQGPWTLAQLIAAKGPIRSLYRTHKALSGLSGDFRYTALLEGAVKRGDPARSLLPSSPDPVSPEALKKVAKELGIDETTAQNFLDRLTIRHCLPPREVIAADNLRKLGLSAPATPIGTIESIYRNVVGLIEDAMDATRLGTRWPKAILTPANYAQEIRDRIEAKRLVREDLNPHFSPLKIGTAILLQQLADPSVRTTALEDKLRAAGLSVQTIRDAQNLRASATKRELELTAATIRGIPALEDVRTRLKVIANAVVEEVRADQGTAAHVWSRVQQRIAEQHQVLDQARLFSQDPFVLLGELCQISDLCEFSWGVRDA